MVNHAKYEERLEFVHTLLSDKFGVEKGQAKVTTLAYDPECPFSYNNFIYKVEIPPGSEFILKDYPSSRKIGFEPIPKGTTTLILRLTNSHTQGMDPAYRVENEVAMMHLASAALGERKLVPSIYAWASAAGSDDPQGWTLQEYMPGEELNAVMPQFSWEKKVSVMEQMAEIVSAFQKFELPESVKGFGALSIRPDDDVIVSGPTPIESAGPWESYEAYFRDYLRVTLETADKRPLINGWRGTDKNLRARLDAFLEKGLSAVFDRLLSRESRVLTHGDMAGANLLVDAASGQLTGLIDFDFAWVAHPSFEFLRSFYDVGVKFQGWSPEYEKDGRGALMDAKLHGFPSPLPASTNERLNWEMAKAWEDALEKFDVLRPRTIVGFQGVADVDALVAMVTPIYLENPDFVARQSEEQLKKVREESERNLDEMLSRFESCGHSDRQ